METLLKDDFLWTGTEGYDLTALQGDYCLRVGRVGKIVYWNLFYQDVSVRKGRCSSIAMAKQHCITAYHQHYEQR